MGTEPSPPDENRVNFFRPRPGFMRRSVAFIWVLLGGWLLLTFGFQLLLRLTQEESSGEGPLTRFSLFGFPFHMLFSGQFLILWFILLCFLFNTFTDRLERRYRPKR